MRAESNRSCPARQRRQLITVLIVGVLLLAQGFYAFAVEPEPYPAIRMPGFGAAPSQDGKFTRDGLEILVRYSDGATRKPTPEALVPDVRFSSARATLDKAFRPLANGSANPNADEQQVISWLRQNATSLSGSQPSEVVFCWRKQIVRISDAAVSYPGNCETVRVRF